MLGGLQMLQKIAWNFFETTGDIKAYLVFKEMESLSESKVNGKDNLKTV